jgi:hypothetical protein
MVQRLIIINNYKQLLTIIYFYLLRLISIYKIINLGIIN